MKMTQYFNRSLYKTWVALLSSFFAMALSHVATATPEQLPLFLSKPVRPIMMLNMSRDHQLFFKAYDDYSDIFDNRPTIADAGGNQVSNPDYLKGIPDGKADTTYVNEYSYYGYFDSDYCYTYNSTNGRFEPLDKRDTNKACAGSNDWSGNFLNWSTMTRMDAIRKILYGGYRQADDSATVLERAFLPNDTHSFAKFYKPASNEVANLKKVVPDAAANVAGVTICNTTQPAVRNKFSQSVTEPPLMRVAKGDFSLWANNERWQCQWKEERGASNGNDPAGSGMNAASSNPTSTSKYGDFNVRVQVCVAGKYNPVAAADNQKCFEYSSGYIKPIGVLQEYGDTDQVHFGLMTGSYQKSKSGGVLRKAASSFQDEVDISTKSPAHTGTGRFKYKIGAGLTNSIIKTLDTLRIYGYDYNSGLYSGGSSDSRWYGVPKVVTGSDNCSWFGAKTGDNSGNAYKRAFFPNGVCSNWGNPQAEIYLESLRYLAGMSSATAEYNANDTGYFSGLTTATWSDPISETESGNYCAPLNVLQFNASTISYDSDELVAGGLSQIGIGSTGALNTLTNAVAANESITNGVYFIGENGGSTTADDYQLCTGKVITDFSLAKGNCPEAPRLEGGFQIAGLAYHARKNGLPAKTSYGREKVTTFGVALAPATPSVTVKVSDTKSFSILPACRNLSTYTSNNPGDRLNGNCAIVDFKIVSQDDATKSGKLYVSWEDMEQGGDFDQDMWGTIDYSVSGDTLTIKTDVFADSTNDPMGFGYVLSGARSGAEAIDAGFRVHSGIKGFTLAGTGCSSACNTNDAATTRTYTLTSTPAGQLKSPLFYAAKWGGYTKELVDKLIEDKGITYTEAELISYINTHAGDAKDSYFYATDPRALAESIHEAVNRIAASVGSSATVAANSTRLDGETRVYQAKFNSKDWSGSVEAFSIASDGKVGTTAKWSTDTTIPLVSTGSSTREIFTYDGAGSGRATVLVNSSLTNAPHLREALKVSGESDYSDAEKRWQWFLGYTNTGLRDRTRLLGDIVNSDPGFAGTGSQRHDQLSASYGAATYLQYVAGKKNRKSLILVGANDGMLHAIDATTKLSGNSNPDEGKEVFTYIPRGVYSKLAALTRPDYSTSSHQYTVDGPVYVSDYFNGIEWRTLVAGTLGAGGRGAYALDITDVLTGAGGGKPIVLFDVSADDTATALDSPTTILKNDLGFSDSKVLVVPTAGDKWTAIWGNGTNSNNGIAKLLAININKPGVNTNADGPVALDTKAKMGASLDNGLSGPALLPDGNGVVSTVYAGDLIGNMWKFDIRAAGFNSWTVAYGNGQTPKPLINVVDANGVAQPISAAPTLGLNKIKLKSAGGPPSTMVYFGTGDYRNAADNTDMQVQTLYGIADTGAEITLANASERESKLHKKVIAAESTAKRTVNYDRNPSPGVTAVDWLGSGGSAKTGWFLDLKLASAALGKGERILAKPLLLYDRVIINTFIPPQNQCSYTGSGWLMELVGVGDMFDDFSVLGNLANTPLLTPIIGDLIPLEAGEKVIIVGSQLGDAKNTSALIGFEGDAGPGVRGRMSWRQLK